MGAPNLGGAPPPTFPEVAFIGRSNVGKSSLINMLCGRRKLARISQHPGKTREFNYYLVDDQFYFVDLPGLGYAKASKTDRLRWKKSILQFIHGRENIVLLVHAVDSRHGLMGIDLEILGEIRGQQMAHLIVLTKSDKLSGNDRTRAITGTTRQLDTLDAAYPIVLTSAVDRRGREEVLEWVTLMIPTEAGSGQ